MDVYLEVGKKKTLAGAVHGPGWLRGGKDEAAALQNLLVHGARYRQVVRAAKLDFPALPDEPEQLDVIERIEGDGGTDFGVPAKIFSFDRQPLSDAELKNQQALLAACWDALDQVVRAAAGQQLRKGPRGGGRELEAIAYHVLGGQGGYLASVGWKSKIPEELGLAQQLAWQREETLKALTAAAQGELPVLSPRGKSYWPARYLVRRSAWHLLDHIWEIEDRIVRP